VTSDSVQETVGNRPSKTAKVGILRPLLLSVALAACTMPYGWADPKPHHMNLPKPTPPGGDALPFVVGGSATAPSAPTMAVIGDSVARDYAYYLGRELGPHGVRVIDGALSGCPVGTLQFISRIHDVSKLLRDGACPRLVVTKQNALINGYAPKVVVWSSITEIWDLDGGGRSVPAGSPEWRAKVMAQWDDTLRRITRGGAKVVVIQPLWYERNPPARLDAPGPSAEKMRDLYARWAALHRDKVTLVDVAPVVCPTGPPCGPVNGIDFRPDSTHFDDPGGALVASYLVAHVPDLGRLKKRRTV
jgi:hypothetical protein